MGTDYYADGSFPVRLSPEEIAEQLDGIVAEIFGNKDYYYTFNLECKNGTITFTIGGCISYGAVSSLDERIVQLAEKLCDFENGCMLVGETYEDEHSSHWYGHAKQVWTACKLAAEEKLAMLIAQLEHIEKKLEHAADERLSVYDNFTPTDD